MSVMILEGKRINEDDSEGAILYCSSSGRAFGPVFVDAEEAQEFIEWLPVDARMLGYEELAEHVSDFRFQRETRANSEHESSGGKFGLKGPISMGYVKALPSDAPPSYGYVSKLEFRTHAEATAAKNAHRLSHCEVVRL